jgi:hypothetical protein
MTRARLVSLCLPTADGRRFTASCSAEREFPSGHPAMQALDPAVYELFLQYR